MHTQVRPKVNKSKVKVNNTLSKEDIFAVQGERVTFILNVRRGKGG